MGLRQKVWGLTPIAKEFGSHQRCPRCQSAWATKVEQHPPKPGLPPFGSILATVICPGCDFEISAGFRNSSKNRVLAWFAGLPTDVVRKVAAAGTNPAGAD